MELRCCVVCMCAGVLQWRLEIYTELLYRFVWCVVLAARDLIELLVLCCVVCMCASVVLAARNLIELLCCVLCMCACVLHWQRGT